MISEDQLSSINGLVGHRFHDPWERLAPPYFRCNGYDAAMLREELEITDRRDIAALLRRARVCRLGLAVHEEAYVVPLSYGYDAEAHVLYFHTAQKGKKIDCIKANPRVCFEVEGSVRIKEGAAHACSWGVLYESVIGYGAIVELLSLEDKTRALQCLTEHQAGRSLDWKMSENAVAGTRVWRLDIESATGKRSFPLEEDLSAS